MNRRRAISEVARVYINPVLHARNLRMPLFLASLFVLSGQGCHTRTADDQRLLLETRVCNHESVKKLLSTGANANVQTELKETPLVLAARNNCIKTAEHLLGAKADPMAEVDWGETPIFYAALHGNAEIVTLLLNAGVDPETKTKDGWTPLMAAAAMGHLDTVRSLLKVGASATERNYEGLSSQDLVGACVKDPPKRPKATEAGSPPDPSTWITELEGFDITPIAEHRTGPYYFGKRPLEGCNEDVLSLLRTSLRGE